MKRFWQTVRHYRKGKLSTPFAATLISWNPFWWWTDINRRASKPSRLHLVTEGVQYKFLSIYSQKWKSFPERAKNYIFERRKSEKGLLLLGWKPSRFIPVGLFSEGGGLARGRVSYGGKVVSYSWIWKGQISHRRVKWWEKEVCWPLLRLLPPNPNGKRSKKQNEGWKSIFENSFCRK